MSRSRSLSPEELNQLLYHFYTALAREIPPASLIARERLTEEDGAKLEILDALRKRRDEAVLDWARSLPLEMVKAVFGARKLAEDLLEDALQTLIEQARQAAKEKAKDWIKDRLAKGKLHISHDTRSLPGAHILFVYEHDSGVLTVIVSRTEPRTFLPVFRQTSYEREITLRPYVATLTARMKRDPLHGFAWPEGLQFRYAPAHEAEVPRLDPLPLTVEQQLAALAQEVQGASRELDLAAILQPARERLRHAADLLSSQRFEEPQGAPRPSREEAALRRRCASLRNAAAQAKSECQARQAAFLAAASGIPVEGPIEGTFADQWKRDQPRYLAQDETLSRAEDEARRRRKEYEAASAAYDALFWGTADRQKEGLRLARMHREKEEKYRLALQKEHEAEMARLHRMRFVQARWFLENVTEDAVQRLADERLAELERNRPWAATERNSLEFEARELLERCREVRLLDAQRQSACEGYQKLLERSGTACGAAERLERSRQGRGLRAETRRQTREVVAQDVRPLTEAVRVILDLDREIRRLWDITQGEASLADRGLSGRSLEQLEDLRKTILRSVIEVGRILDEVNYQENVRTGFRHPLDARLFLDTELSPEEILRLRRDNERPPESIQEAVRRLRRDRDLLLRAMRPVTEAKGRLLQRYLEGVRRLEESLRMHNTLQAPLPDAVRNSIEDCLKSWEQVRRQAPGSSLRGSAGKSVSEVDRLLGQVRDLIGALTPAAEAPAARESLAQPSAESPARGPSVEGPGRAAQQGPSLPTPLPEAAGRRVAAGRVAGLPGLLGEKAVLIALGLGAAAVAGIGFLAMGAAVLFLALRPQEPAAAPEPVVATQPPVEAPPAVELPEGLGTGDVQITLLWQGDADLDLHVIDPAGEEIYYMSPTSSSGGQLDRDTIPCNEDVPQPVENIFWPSGGAPHGAYAVSVHYYAPCTIAEPMSYEVIIRLGGAVYQDITGTLANGERVEIMRFDY